MKQKYIWTEFRKLKRNEQFWLGTAAALKANFFSAWRGGMRVFVSPFRKVRSTRPFGKPAVISAAENNRAIGYLAKTHSPLGDADINENRGLGYKALAIYAPAVKTEPVAGEETP